MKGWYGNKQAHSLASRGIRTRNAIEGDLRLSKEKQLELNDELRVYKLIDIIENKYQEYIDDEAYDNMENAPLTEDEFYDVLESMDTEDYINIMYGGDISYFLSDWSGIVAEYQEYFQMDDFSNDREVIEEYRKNNEKGYGDAGTSSNETYIHNLSHSDFNDFLLDVIIPEHGINIFNYEMDNIRMSETLSNINNEKDFLQYAIDISLRDEDNKRFQPSIERKRELMKKAYKEGIKYEELNKDEYELIDYQIKTLSDVESLR